MDIDIHFDNKMKSIEELVTSNGVAPMTALDAFDYESLSDDPFFINMESKAGYRILQRQLILGHALCDAMTWDLFNEDDDDLFAGIRLQLRCQAKSELFDVFLEHSGVDDVIDALLTDEDCRLLEVLLLYYRGHSTNLGSPFHRQLYERLRGVEDIFPYPIDALLRRLRASLDN